MNELGCAPRVFCLSLRLEQRTCTLLHSCCLGFAYLTGSCGQSRRMNEFERESSTVDYQCCRKQEEEKKIGNGSCRRFNGNVRSWFYYGRSELYRSLRLPGKFVPKGSPVASALPINAKRVGGRGTPSRRCSLRTLPSYLRLRFAVGSPEKTEIKKGPFVFKRQYQTGREHTHFNFCQPAPSRSAHWTSDGETAPSSDG